MASNENLDTSRQNNVSPAYIPFYEESKMVLWKAYV